MATISYDFHFGKEINIGQRTGYKKNKVTRFEEKVHEV